MAVGHLLESHPEFYVGLASDGRIVEVYNALDDATLARVHDDVVSIGILSTIATDYDEVYSLGEGLEPEEDTP